jgi:hypothetical protein
VLDGYPGRKIGESIGKNLVQIGIQLGGNFGARFLDALQISLGFLLLKVGNGA